MEKAVEIVDKSKETGIKGSSPHKTNPIEYGAEVENGYKV